MEHLFESQSRLVLQDSCTEVLQCATPAAGENAKKDSAKEEKHMHKKQGTFMGVYLPVAASMWGVLIFIRFSVIVGYSGWVMSVSFVLLSAFVQVLTTLSLCAVLSNSSNLSGGIFGILKRNLGGEISGVVCLLYYLGITTLSSIELLGSVQAIDFVLGATKTYSGDSITGSTYWDQLVIGGPLLLLLAGVRAFDVRYVHVITFVILLAVLLSYFFGFLGLFLTAGTWRGTLGSIPGVTGLDVNTFLDNAFPNFSPPNYTNAQLEDYFGETSEMVDESAITSSASALSIIFPMFLGVFQGGNKAADLQTPHRSIVKGTLLAILTSFSVYCLLFLLFAAVAQRDVLKAEFLLFSELTWPTEYIGIIGTVLVGIGACVELLEIGPTVLFAVASDGLFSFLQQLGLHRKTKRGEPVRAVVVSFTINFCLLFVASAYFEVLASVVTMLFLQAYLVMHLSLLLNEFQQHISWRPTFKYYHWSTALVGSVSTLVLMFYIEWIMALATLLVAFFLLLLAKIVEEPKRKGLANRNLAKGRAVRSMLTDDLLATRALLRSSRNRRGSAMTASQDINEAREDRLDDVHDDHVWEPQLLCILDSTENPDKEDQHIKLLYFAEQLSSRGLLPQLTVVAALEPFQPTQECPVRDKYLSLRLRLFSLCMYSNLKAFPKVTLMHTDSDMSSAYLMLMQSVGVGPLTPNVVLISMENENFAEIVQNSQLVQKELFILKDSRPLHYKHVQEPKREMKSNGPRNIASDAKQELRTALDIEQGLWQDDLDDDTRFEDKEMPEDQMQMDNIQDLDSLYFDRFKRKRQTKLVSRRGTIDVWWIKHQGGLPVLLAHLLLAHSVWKNCRIRVLTVLEVVYADDLMVASITVKIQTLLRQMRVSAEVQVLQVHPKTFRILRDTCHPKESSSPDPNASGKENENANEINKNNKLHHYRMPSVMDIFPEALDDKDYCTRSTKNRQWANQMYNKLFQAHSKDAELVVLSLPSRGKEESNQEYKAFLQNYTEKLDRVVMVHTPFNEKDETFARYGT